MTTRLSQLQPGESARVTNFQPGDNNFRRKLLSLGITPGTRVDVIRTAPMGDPMEIKVRGFSLSLRKAEANTVLVENR